MHGLSARWGAHGHDAPMSGWRELGKCAAERRALKSALRLTLGYPGVEVVGGWLANGVALLSDAAHMFTDVIALGLGFFGVWIADQPATDRKTYGYYRAEILVALTGHCALSAHAVVEDGATGDEVLAEMSDRLAERFDIRHVTIQLELRRRRYAEPVH